MAERKPSVDVEALLEESRWMEGLARHLVGPSGAEDLVQDTLVVALQHAPAERACLAPWLAVVLRRLGRDRLRGDANRGARERAAARGEALPASADLVGRAEQHRLLVDSVLSLREPYRTILLQRYFEDLPANEIARRRGVLPATVRSQCARALELLRGELDRRHGGERTEWMRALALAFGGLGAPLELSGGAALSAGPTLAAWAVGIGIGTLVAALGWMSLRGPSGDASAPLVPLAGRSAPTDTFGPSRGADRGVSSTEARTSGERVALAALETAPEQSSTGARPRGAHLRGRVLLPSGLPAAGATAALGGSLRAAARAQGREASDVWSDLAATCSVDGAFEMHFAPPPDFEFVLEIAREGFAIARWTWSAIEPGSTIDLGDVVLREAATLIVSLVDGAGRMPTGPWQILVTARAGEGGDGREDFLIHATLDPTLGSARVEGVPAGPVSLGAHSVLTGPVASTTLVLEPWEVREVRLLYDGPDPARRIVVQPSFRPRYPQRPSADAFVLRGAGVERRSKALRGIHGAHVFDDLEPGSYSVHLEDGRFAPWSVSGVAPGRRVVANLAGAAALVLRVVDQRTDRPITEYGAQVRLERNQTHPDLVRLRAVGPGAAQEERLDGLVPEPQTLLVESPGYGVAEIPLLDLAPGEVRRLTARLVPPALLAGVVLRSDGSPAAGVAVQVVEPGHTALQQRPGNERGVRRETTRTDDEGRFAFEGLLEATWDLFAWEQPWGVAQLPAIELARGERRDDLRLTLPPAARIHGNLLDLAGAACGELELAFAPDIEPTVARAFLRRPGEDVAVSPDGAFVSGPLPPGRIGVRLRFREYERLAFVDFGAGGGSATVSSGQEGEDRIVFELELEPGEERRLDLSLGADLPACLTVHVSGLHSPDRFGISALAPLERRAGGAGARFDPNGSARLGPLPPGPYELHLYALSGPGYHIDPRVHSLAPGEHRELRLAVRLTAASLLVREADTGLPLRSSPVMVSAREDPQGLGVALDTDDEGRLTLELLPATYRFFRSRPGLFQRGPRVELDWTPAGPAVESIELE